MRLVNNCLSDSMSNQTESGSSSPIQKYTATVISGITRHPLFLGSCILVSFSLFFFRFPIKELNQPLIRLFIVQFRRIGIMWNKFKKRGKSIILIKAILPNIVYSRRVHLSESSCIVLYICCSFMSWNLKNILNCSIISIITGIDFSGWVTNKRMSSAYKAILCSPLYKYSV